MTDAVTAARSRIDRALATLERKVLELKARPAEAAAALEHDLFAAIRESRSAELEAAAREASAALAEASERIRALMIEPADGPEPTEQDETV
jgi:hypothetical protein